MKNTTRVLVSVTILNLPLVLFLAAAFLLPGFAITGGAASASTDPLIQRVCEQAGGVLYTAKDTPDAPAICHKKGPALSTDEPLWEWETVLFVEEQV